MGGRCRCLCCTVTFCMRLPPCSCYVMIPNAVAVETAIEDKTNYGIAFGSLASDGGIFKRQCVRALLGAKGIVTTGRCIARGYHQVHRAADQASRTAAAHEGHFGHQ